MNAYEQEMYDATIREVANKREALSIVYNFVKEYYAPLAIKCRLVAVINLYGSKIACTTLAYLRTICQTTKANGISNFDTGRLIAVIDFVVTLDSETMLAGDFKRFWDLLQYAKSVQTMSGCDSETLCETIREIQIV